MGVERDMTEAVVVLVTASSTREAERIAKKLVEEKLVACVNIATAVRSIYKWKGSLCEEGEVLMVMKSVQSRLPELIQRIQKLHSYEVPEILALPVLAGSESYLNWVLQQTRPE